MARGTAPPDRHADGRPDLEILIRERPQFLAGFFLGKPGFRIDLLRLQGLGLGPLLIGLGLEFAIGGLLRRLRLAWQLADTTVSGGGGR